MSVFDYHRRSTWEVKVGNIPLGGDNPIRLQSMTSTSTMDTEGCVAQTKRIVDAGADYVRLTAQGVREADNIGLISQALRADGYTVPLVADIHFNPRAAFAAAETSEKVRINPGNFVDPGRVFRKIDYTEEEYAAELRRIDEALTPFLELCRKNNRAIRIGVNHGSLSDRIMSRYGDTPAGMVESAMEFLRVCLKRDFRNVVISIKASNVGIMVETVRLLAHEMEREQMHFPLHLGVTEAGDGEDGRVKSAVGIGTLLAEGLGDTIRVSLSEDPEREIPVARQIAQYIESLAEAPSIEGVYSADYDTLRPQRRKSNPIGIVGGDNQPIVVGSRWFGSSDCRPDMWLDRDKFVEIDASTPIEQWHKLTPGDIVMLSSDHSNFIGSIKAALHQMMRRGIDNPVIIKASYRGLGVDEVKIRAAIDLGALLLAGFSDGICIDADTLDDEQLSRLAFGILQSTRQRITHTEYISCPGCGRTLFNLQSTLAKVKEATSHLRGLKIGVMGCIVNGPGEMADADYGYIGAGKGRISLYKGKECILKNIPEEEAVERLIELIKTNGDWKEK